jgi:hypothetical protein
MGFCGKTFSHYGRFFFCQTRIVVAKPAHFRMPYSSHRWRQFAAYPPRHAFEVTTVSDS